MLHVTLIPYHHAAQLFFCGHERYGWSSPDTRLTQWKIIILQQNISFFATLSVLLMWGDLFKHANNKLLSLIFIINNVLRSSSAHAVSRRRYRSCGKFGLLCELCWKHVCVVKINHANAAWGWKPNTKMLIVSLAAFLLESIKSIKKIWMRASPSCKDYIKGKCLKLRRWITD